MYKIQYNQICIKHIDQKLSLLESSLKKLKKALGLWSKTEKTI